MKAAEENKPEEIDLLVVQGADIRTRNAWGRNALHIAASKGNLEAIKCLLSLEIKVDSRVDYDGWTGFGTTSLHEASRKGHYEVVEYLVSRGSDINTGDKNGLRPLHWAVLKSNKPLVEFFLKAGAKIDVQDKDGRTALHCASAKGNEDIVLLLIDYKADREKKTFITIADNGIKAVQAAAGRGWINIVKILLAKSNTSASDMCDVEHSRAMSLQDAVVSGQAEIVEWFIDQGEDINDKDSLGKTVLHRASLAGNPYVAKVLVRHGADINAQDNFGVTALLLATMQGNEEVVRELAKVPSIDINARGGHGCTALMLAAGQGHEGVVQELLRVPSIDAKADYSYMTKFILNAVEVVLHILELVAWI